MFPLEILLLAVVTAGGVTDLATGRIHNALTYPAVLAGLAGALVLEGGPAFGEHLLALAVGFVPFFLLYLGGGLGGGDVKLMAAVGALGGYPLVLNSMLSAILLGGLAAVLMVIWQSRFRETVRYVGGTLGSLLRPGTAPPAPGGHPVLPFGAMICLGTYLAVAARWLGFASPAGMLLP